MYQVCQTIQLLTQHTAWFSPPRHLPVQEIEHEPCQRENHRCPEVVGVVRQQITCWWEDRERPAYTIHDRNEVSQTEIPNICQSKGFDYEVLWWRGGQEICSPDQREMPFCVLILVKGISFVLSFSLSFRYGFSLAHGGGGRGWVKSKHCVQEGYSSHQCHHIMAVTRLHLYNVTGHCLWHTLSTSKYKWFTGT